jgi:hypothetical protein
MLKLTLDVTLEDGTTFPGVKVGPGDFVRFERHFQTKIGAIASVDDMSMEQILYLAWSPLHRTGASGLEFDDFCDQVENLDFKSGAHATPTPPAPSEDDSSS